MQVKFSLGWQEFAVDGVEAKDLPGILEVFKRMRRVEWIKAAKGFDGTDYEYVHVLKFGRAVSEVSVMVGNLIEEESKVRKYVEPTAE